MKGFWAAWNFWLPYHKWPLRKKNRCVTLIGNLVYSSVNISIGATLARNNSPLGRNLEQTRLAESSALAGWSDEEIQKNKEMQV